VLFYAVLEIFFIVLVQRCTLLHFWPKIWNQQPVQCFLCFCNLP